MRDLEIQVIEEKISYGKMLELIQEEVIKNYHILNTNILLKTKITHMKYKFIPVDDSINKAIAFANTLDVNNIKNVQKIKQKPFYIETLDAIKMLQK